MNNELYHYGMPRRSGRYPWGSGENPFQHDSPFTETVNGYKAKGLKTNKEIAEAMGMTVTEYLRRKSVDIQETKAAKDAYIFTLKDKGLSNRAIGERIGKNESYVRNRLKQRTQEKAKELDNTADMLRESLKTNKYLDVTAGTELLLNVKKTKMDAAVQKLKDEGYEVVEVKVEQAASPGKFTTLKVLAPPGSTKADVWKERDKIGLITNVYNDDGTRSIRGIEKPVSVDSSRIYIKYAEDGGAKKDGVIELRRGVPDLSMGNSSYAQVRIGVNDKYYMKGMAMYSDEIPKGYDIVFNTPKSSSKTMEEVFKPMKETKDGEIDWSNPFGSSIKMEEGRIVGQRHYKDKDGNDKLSPINIVREEGDWETWSKTLASQFLSKQPLALIDQQLNITYSRHNSDFDRIKSLTNGEVKRKLLLEFADKCDSSASHLKAAALPRQSSKVILPLTNIKDTEVYAPTYRNGEQVALVRYPHGGLFEIPILTVNNRNRDGIKNIGPLAPDAIGINTNVATILSGADFDGDSVTVIPITNQKIKNKKPLKELEGFDPKQRYPEREGMRYLTKGRATQTEMGKITNLITDMTLQGADEHEVARAVKHSMVVIDAAKHKLDYKASEIENGISSLKKEYQGASNAGAGTLISRSNAEIYVDDYRKKIDPETGALIFEPSGSLRRKSRKNDKTGEWTTEYVPRQVKTTRMKMESDARNLMSGPDHIGTAQEVKYADYANKLKALANEARKEALSIKNIEVSDQAKETYKDEIESLNAKLNTALQNKPYERQAQIIASVEIENAKRDAVDWDSDDIKKLSNQILAEARYRTGANKKEASVKITDKEWEAIQAGAISSSKLRTILNNTDMDRVKKLASPVESRGLSNAQIRLIKAYSKANYDLSEIADALGVSTSTVSKYLKEQKGETS